MEQKFDFDWLVGLSLIIKEDKIEEVNSVFKIFGGHVLFLKGERLNFVGLKSENGSFFVNLENPRGVVYHIDVNEIDNFFDKA
jgi:hypothetical protein